jgi:hypothetical protein
LEGKIFLGLGNIDSSENRGSTYKLNYLSGNHFSILTYRFWRRCEIATQLHYYYKSTSVLNCCNVVLSKQLMGIYLGVKEMAKLYRNQNPSNEGTACHCHWSGSTFHTSRSSVILMGMYLYLVPLIFMEMYLCLLAAISQSNIALAKNVKGMQQEGHGGICNNINEHMLPVL